MPTTHFTNDDLVELDERESSGIRVTLVWNRATRTVSVLVADEHSGEAFSIAVERDENALELFHHPFRYAAHRRRTRQLAAS